MRLADDRDRLARLDTGPLALRGDTNLDISDASRARFGPYPHCTTQGRSGHRIHAAADTRRRHGARRGHPGQLRVQLHHRSPPRRPTPIRHLSRPGSVAYDTPAQAAKAIIQWHTAATTCPHTPVNSTAAGVPDLVEKILQSELNVAVLPAKNNAITMESATAVGQGTLYNVSILQAHGRFLDIIYLDSTHPITAQELAVAVQLAVTTGHRLVG